MTLELFDEAKVKDKKYFDAKREPLGKLWYKCFKKASPRTLVTLVFRIRSFHTRVNAHLADKDIFSLPVSAATSARI